MSSPRWRAPATRSARWISTCASRACSAISTTAPTTCAATPSTCRCRVARGQNPATLDSRAEAEAEDQIRFDAAIAELSGTCDFILIDCPGSHTGFARMAHAIADTLITPMNDSLVDFDLLARLDPESGRIKGPSVYSEMVWKARQARAATGRRQMDWVVLRNRMAALDARNKRRVGVALTELATRIGFRLVPGFSERVVFRELFLSGLTLLDLKETDPAAMTMSNIAARQEVRDLLRALDLPDVVAAV